MPHILVAFFEVMIKAAKKAIVAILGNSDVTDEELMTAFTGAETLINSRPLTYQSANPQDDVPLTPNHLICGQLGGMFCSRDIKGRSLLSIKTMVKSSGTHQTFLEALVTRMDSKSEPKTKMV